MEIFKIIALMCPLVTPNPQLKDCNNSFMMTRINHEICWDYYTRCTDAKLGGNLFNYRPQEQAKALKECIKARNIGRKQNE